MFSRIVENSHMRCEKYGISKKQKLSSRILDLKDITRRLEDSSDLILASETIIKKLYNELKETHFLAVLTDCEGCVLSIIGDEKIGGLVFNIGIRPGVFMDEKSIGTNAISLALIENKPIQLHGKEHYLNVFDEMTCSCVPIHDDNDRLIGTLDLSGYKYSIHTHILEVLIATSYAIEKNYALTKLV
ncbi:MAG: AAA family ATPase, partial [Clostridiales bacterium]|nr:AAA family ATPase [Clostridiales bacterium]